MDQHLDDEYSDQQIWNTQDSLEANYSSYGSTSNYINQLSPSQNAHSQDLKYYGEPTPNDTGTLSDQKQAEDGDEMLPGDAIEQQYGDHQYPNGYWQQMIPQNDQLSYSNELAGTQGAEDGMQDDQSLEGGQSDSVVAESQQGCASTLDKAFAIDDSSFVDSGELDLRQLAAHLVESVGGEEAKKMIDKEIEEKKALNQQMQLRMLNSRLMRIQNGPKAKKSNSSSAESNSDANEEETRLLEEIRVVQEKITELKLSQITEIVMSQERWNETLTEQVEVDRQGDTFIEVELSKLQKLHEKKCQLLQVTTTRVERMMDECAELQKRKSKTDELLKVMGHRIGILSIHLPPSSLDPQAAAAMQELSALKATLDEAGQFRSKMRYRKDNQRRAKKHYSLMLQAAH